MVSRDREKPREQLLDELADLRQQLASSRVRESSAQADEEFYADIVGAVREPLVVLDVNLLVILASQAFYDVFQVTPEETQGNHLYTLGKGQWDIPRLTHLLREVLPENRAFSDFELDHDFPGVGHKRLLMNARQMYRRSGSTELILLAIEDVTQKRGEEKVAYEDEEVLQRNSRLASIGLLASGMTHELNNPLGIILGYSELALDQPLNQPTRHYIQVIREATERAARIVHNVLSFARGGGLDKQTVDVRAILERTVGLKSHEFKAASIRVTRKFPPEALNIAADPFQMVEAILNIITNAQQAMTAAHGGGEIVLYARESGNRVRISIADNGPGIVPEHLERIFDPFFTTKELGQGTGLGLSVTHGIIRQHGGEVWAESVVGKGTTMHIELPRSPLDEPGPAVLTPPPPVVEPALRVLAVNDESAFREILSVALLSEGHTVDQARDGEEAWDMLRSRHYDCIILNLWMPRMGGQELYQRIAEYNSDLARRCIFITGAAHSQEVDRFIAATGNPSLRKPFTLAEIRRLLLLVAG